MQFIQGIVDAIKTPIRNEKGAITGLIAILRDITELWAGINLEGTLS